MTARDGRQLCGAAELSYEDVEAGDWFETSGCVVSVEMIDAFAALTGDRFEIHMDEAAARCHGFTGRVAHGLLVLSLVDGLKNQAEARFRAIASLGWDFRFERPVLAGDTI
ncbi:MAG: MaoC family dehydratase, partial [Mesorhizobium sp.]